MVRLAYTITVALLLGGCAKPSAPVYSEDLQTRLERDRIREQAQAGIMREIPQVRYDPDIKLIRELMHTSHHPGAYVVNPEYTPDVQIFTNKPVAFEDAVIIISRSLGYRPVFDKNVDRHQKVVLHDRSQSLENITEKLGYQTQTQVLAFPESRVLLVTEKH